MQVYLAASFRRQTEMRRVRDDLALIGIRCTSRWLDVDASTEPPLADCARDDLEDIRIADALILCGEDESAGYLSGGRFVEMGYALHAGKLLFLVGSVENAFGHLPQVRRCATWPDCMVLLWALGGIDPHAAGTDHLGDECRDGLGAALGR